jgi:hypothetical protein
LLSTSIFYATGNAGISRKRQTYKKEYVYINICFELEKYAMETFKVFKVAFGK